jgi:hypothetical protein
MATGSSSVYSGLNARVALLMATRDQPHVLKSVRSLLVQTHQKFTLTIVDDGSSIAVSQYLQGIDDSRITLIKQAPQGRIAALNIAIKKSKPAAFYGVVYASCFYAPHYLALLLNQLTRHPGHSGAYCCFCDGQTGTIFKEPFFDPHELLVRDFIGPGLIFRGHAFQTAGDLFLSEKQGLLETWQRMTQKSGPFLQVSDVAVRWHSDGYDSPPQRPALDLEKQVYPYLKPSFLIPEAQSVDSELLVLLSQTGHLLLPEKKENSRADFILCGNLKNTGHSMRLAQQHGAGLLFAINDRADLDALTQPQARFLLASAHVLTRQASVARALQDMGHQATVYMPQMTEREVKRFLSRLSPLLYRHRCVFLIRVVGGPALVEATLNALSALNRPPEFAELLIFTLDGNKETEAWLTARGLHFFSAQEAHCFPELLFLLKQMKGQYVLSLDAGVIPEVNYINALMPLLAHPQVGMASGLMNSVRGDQRLPFESGDLGSLRTRWKDYHPLQEIERVGFLVDSAFMARKSALEYVLQTFTEVEPLMSDYTFTDLFMYLGFYHVLSRRTVAFNTLPYL